MHFPMKQAISYIISYPAMISITYEEKYCSRFDLWGIAVHVIMVECAQAWVNSAEQDVTPMIFKADDYDDCDDDDNDDDEIK